MKKLAEILVTRRILIFSLMMLLAVFSAFLIPRVKVNTDMTKYLPESSSMKKGIDILMEEFTGLEDLATGGTTVRVMFRGLTEKEKPAMEKELAALPNVDYVSWQAGDVRYEKGEYSLYIVHFECDYSSPEMREFEKALKAGYSGRNEMVYTLDSTAQQGVPLWIFAAAVALLVLILVILSSSYLEPFLFLFAIGIAVVINMGTNALLPSVSETTFSIAAILQLALSIDYSIILTNRYRQELTAARGSIHRVKPQTDAGMKKGEENGRGGTGGEEKGLPEAAARKAGKIKPAYPKNFCAEDRQICEQAMKTAIASAFSSVTSSALTTVVGLLALVFMSFKIGADMGIVMAKGVFLSMVCIFTVLPALVLFFERWIGKTKKRQPAFRMDAFAGFAFRFRRVILVVFVLFFALVSVLRGNTKIAFTLVAPNEVDPVFPLENQIVVLYANENEAALPGMIPELEADPLVVNVMSWPNTLGNKFSPEDIKKLLTRLDLGVDVPDLLIQALYRGYFGSDDFGKLSPYEMVDYASKTFTKDSFLYPRYISDDLLELLSDAKAQIADAEGQLRGEKHSIMMIATVYPGESEETGAFVDKLRTLCDENLPGGYYLIGNTAMAYEMVDSFGGEFNFISILTAAAIFLVVLLTFRSFVPPLILIVLIQSAVYATMVMMNLQGMTVYYLALLVVQGILMGSTIDYGILLTGYYREFRQREDIPEALRDSLNHSVHTILTSGIVIVVVTAVVGYAFADPAVQQIVHAISKGAAVAILLILLLLPGVLAALDRFTAGKRT